LGHELIDWLRSEEALANMQQVTTSAQEQARLQTENAKKDVELLKEELEASKRLVQGELNVSIINIVAESKHSCSSGS